ncbi:MAG: NAD(P)-dependent oxidoreductase [Candidatus Borkfalkiaceae bacterium]|nr:NAD(P)-dependent oxidoreductase [Clostridia bacterium]MDY6223115.1 NAD(P)-dependent oxidoreductase [Christensenellaceae bacterium]
MKLAFYSLWDDEIVKLSDLQRLYLFESVRSREILSLKNAELCECCDGASVYGNAEIDEPLFKALASYGVKFLSVRDETTKVNYAAAQKYGVRVCRASFPPDAVAEFTLMLTLAALRKYKQALWLQQINDYSIARLKGEILSQKCVGVVGESATEKRLVEMLGAIGCQVSVLREENGGSSGNENGDESGNTAVADEFYKNNEVIIYPSLLKNPEKYRVNKETLKKMRDGVVLVNTVSGDFFDVPSIIEGVENKKIGALAMDVFKGERGIYHEDRTYDILNNREMAYIRQFPNVTLTQHMGFYTAYSMQTLIERSVEGLTQLIRNGKSEYETYE